jgi:hypothetical protein
MGGTGARICTERRLGGIVAVTPVAVEVWMSSWWNDWGHVGSERGSHVPNHCVRSRSSHRAEMGAVVRGPMASCFAKGLHVSFG